MDIHKILEKEEPLSNEEIEKLKERYPVEPISEESPDKESVEGLKEEIEEINLDENTRERG